MEASKRQSENRSFYLYQDQIEWLEANAKRYRLRGASAFLRDLLDLCMAGETNPSVAETNPSVQTEAPQRELPVSDVPETEELEEVSFVKISEAAKMKRTHRQTIREAILRGRLRAYQSGGIWLIDPVSLAAYTPKTRNKD